MARREIWAAFNKRGMGGGAVYGPDEFGAPDPWHAIEAFNRGDFNLDGNNDILFYQNGWMATWFMNGQNFVGSDWISSTTSPFWKVKATPDVTRNGKVDIVLQHDDGWLAYWNMDGNTVTSSHYFIPSQVGDPSWRIAGTPDFDRSTVKDLVWQHDGGSLAAWYMGGANNDEMISSVMLNPSHPGDFRWRVAGTGDFDRDGKTDLLFQYSNPGGGGDGDLAVWHMDGVNLKQNGANLLNPSNPGDPRWRVAAVEDFNRDGYPDLVWQFENQGSMAVWFMNDYTLVSGCSLGNPGAGWKAVAPK